MATPGPREPDAPPDPARTRLGTLLFAAAWTAAGLAEAGRIIAPRPRLLECPSAHVLPSSVTPRFDSAFDAVAWSDAIVLPAADLIAQCVGANHIRQALELTYLIEPVLTVLSLPALDLLDLALTLARQFGDDRVTAAIQFARARALTAARKPAAALKAVEQARAIYTGVDDRLALAELASACGAARNASGDRPRARRDLAAAQRLYREVGYDPDAARDSARETAAAALGLLGLVGRGNLGVHFAGSARLACASARGLDAVAGTDAFTPGPDRAGAPAGRPRLAADAYAGHPAPLSTGVLPRFSHWSACGGIG